LANNLNLGIVVGAALSSSVNTVFASLDQRAARLGRTLQQARIGGAATGELTRYRTELERINVLRRNEATRSRIGGQMLGAAGMAVGAAFALAGPMKQALSFEHELQQFGNIVNFNNAQLGATKNQLNAIASATNQYPGQLLSALNTLASKGLDPVRATESLNIIGRTATATGADVNELAGTAFTLIDAMGLKPTELPKAMDMLAQAGKLGSFELKDMATYFPQLTAQAKSLGITGTQGIATMGAALQIAMKGASDPAQAANNFQNFLTKLTSMETVTRFKKMGVDVQKVMTEATQKGADPVIAMVEKIKELTGGNKFKMSELFSDMQVLGFLNPMIANLDEFNRIKQESLTANNVINKDYAAMMATGTEQQKAAGIEAQKLGNVIGSALGPALNSIVGTVKPIVQAFGEWAAKNTTVVTSIIGLVGGLIGLKVAMLAGGYAITLVSDAWIMASGAMAFFTNGLLGTRIGLAALQVQAVGMAIAQKAMAAVTSIVTAAQWLWNAALSANPIGLVIIGITAFGALAYTVYKNWEPIMAWFRENFAWLGTAVEKVKGYASEIGNALSSAGKWLTTPIGGATGAGTRGGLSDLAGKGKGAAIGGAMAATLALPAGANTPLPPLSKAKQPQSVMYNTNATINVTQKPGEDGESLANRIVSKIERKHAADKRRALHD
jgi:TP901 family phage tail tape measure protein